MTPGTGTPSIFTRAPAGIEMTSMAAVIGSGGGPERTMATTAAMMAIDAIAPSAHQTRPRRDDASLTATE